jgi:hypothetical protein
MPKTYVMSMVVDQRMARRRGGLGGRTIHHDVHAGELRPNLSENADVGTIDHVRLEQLEIGNVSIVPFKLAHLLDFLEFELDKGIVRIAFTMNQREHSVTVFPAVLSC